MKIRKRVMSLGLCVILAVLMTSCGKKDENAEPVPPEAYEIQENTAPSFNTLVGEESGVLTSVAGEGTSDAPTETDGGSDELPGAYVYTYEEIDDSAKAVEDYVGALTKADSAFRVVTANAETTALPDFSTETGSVILAKTSEQGESILRLDIKWFSKGCTIEVSLRPGEIREAKESEGSPVQMSVRFVTASEAVQFIESLTPSVLGLPGESMEEYHVYYMDAEVNVNGTPCTCLRVYSTAVPEGSNVYEGTYMLSVDKRKLYRQAADSAAVVELTLPTASA